MFYICFNVLTIEIVQFCCVKYLNVIAFIIIILEANYLFSNLLLPQGSPYKLINGSKLGFFIFVLDCGV